MANDGEVGKELARSKEIFLREPPGFTSGPPKLYNVVEEFPFDFDTRFRQAASVGSREAVSRTK